MKIVNKLLEGNPAFAECMIQYAELVKRGHAKAQLVFNNKHKVLSALTDEDKLMGAIVYTFNNDTKSLWNILTFTLPEYRRQGVYSALHAKLESLAIEANMLTIEASIAYTNEPMLNAAKKIDKDSLLFVRTTKKVSY